MALEVGIQPSDNLASVSLHAGEVLGKKLALIVKYRCARRNPTFKMP